jgi:hypothetical protein
VRDRRAPAVLAVALHDEEDACGREGSLTLLAKIAIWVLLPSVGCRREPAAEAIRTEPISPTASIASTTSTVSSAPSSASPPPSAPSASSLEVTARKRTHGVPGSVAPPVARARPNSWKGFRRRNPVDAASHKPIAVAKDDSCYLADQPPRPIDCPHELDDKAWDYCTDGALMDGPGGCWCSPIGGSTTEGAWIVPCAAAPASGVPSAW